MEYQFSIRDPVHGFIAFNELEWDVINSPAFQRLRRIRQLAWTDYVYPGAMHTRFEHSLGVCHVATKLFNAIASKDADILQSEYKFQRGGIERQRQIIRLAALMHDLGHGPFSHAAEDVFPEKDDSDRKYVHEDYSEAIARYLIGDIIEDHPLNVNNFNISMDDITDIFAPASKKPASVLWKEIVSGQMDADRMDYLLRDSYHAGVSYGHYDLDRVINTLCLCEVSEIGGHVVGVEEDGLHSVEGLLIARYMMFTQVYFHKTRAIYDFHYEEALKSILADHGGVFPKPLVAEIEDYSSWDDWRVLAELRDGKGGDHGKRLMERDHYRLVYCTPETPNADQLDRFDKAAEALDADNIIKIPARKSWYKFQNEEIRVRVTNAGRQESIPLATLSTIVDGLKTVNLQRIYVPQAYRETAQTILEKMGD